MKLQTQTPDSSPTEHWTTLFRAFSDALEWAFDRAADLARDYPDEVAIIERVRTFARKQIAGDPAHLRIEDLLFAFALVAGAVERQLSSARAPQVSSLAGYLGKRKALATKRIATVNVRFADKRTP